MIWQLLFSEKFFLMYIPKYFRVEDYEAIKNFMMKNSFALLITHHENKPWATHIPMEVESSKTGETVLRGHVSKGNVQWKSFQRNDSALAVFSGPHTYVSSSWYSHINVPTWNYIAVHVEGRLRLLNDEETYDSLKKLVDRYEVISEKPVSVEGMKEHVIKEMKGIAGFEMSIDKMEGKWKLSQNRKEEDFKNIIVELEKINDINANQVAAKMKNLMR